MRATVFEIDGRGPADPPPPLVKGVGTKRLGKGRVKARQRTKTMVIPEVRSFYMILLVGEFNPSGQTRQPKLTETYRPLKIGTALSLISQQLRSTGVFQVEVFKFIFLLNHERYHHEIFTVDAET